MLNKIIKVARGLEVADLVIKNANIINVFTGEYHINDVAIADGYIACIGNNLIGRETIDAKGAYLSPSFIDGHVHLESSMVLPFQFAKATMPSGTTTVIADPHEITNVLGLQGISYIREVTKNIPLDVYIMLPSCVPATNMETSGYNLEASDISVFMNEPWVLGLAEMMNFPGVINCDQQVLDKLELVGNKKIDGHVPALSGNDLNAYVAAGISSDHECTYPEEALEKLRLGMYIMIREGTVAKDLEALLPAINQENSRRCVFVTDDRCPLDLYGHINTMVKRAVKAGISPINAIQMATINTAEYFRIPFLGAIAPGYKADMLILDDLENFEPKVVIKSGNVVAKDGKFVVEESQQAPILRGSINVKWIEKEDFKIKAETDTAKIINLIPKQLITKATEEKIKVVDGYAESDPDKDILKIAVIERHKGTGNIGIGFVKGFELKNGAIASTVAHDSHNMVIVGTNDEDMYYAAIELVKSQGGKIVVQNGKTLAHLPLPIAGLISHKPIEEVIEKVSQLSNATKTLGCKLDDAFLAMAFLSLPVIPEIKITDKGLVDVNRFKFTNLFV